MSPVAGHLEMLDNSAMGTHIDPERGFFVRPRFDRVHALVELNRKESWAIYRSIARLT